MKLVRYKSADGIKMGAVVGENIVDIQTVAPEYSSIKQLAGAGRDAITRLANLVGDAPADIALADAELVAPIEQPGKYLAIGMNYGKHAAEADKLGVPKATHQVWFNKQTTCVAGPYDEIDPGVTEKLDYEAELGVVIGDTAKYVSEADAHKHIFGYFVANDVSARDYQFHSQTFMMGKSFDTHGPIGPWIVTADEIPDPHALGLRCFVNGEKRQDSDTSQLIHNIWQQIAYLTTAFTLEPGDLIATGTPEGVGVAMDPPTFLQPGDVVRCEVDSIGSIENRVSEKRR